MYILNFQRRNKFQNLLRSAGSFKSYQLLLNSNILTIGSSASGLMILFAWNWYAFLNSYFLFINLNLPSFAGLLLKGFLVSLTSIKITDKKRSKFSANASIFLCIFNNIYPMSKEATAEFWSDSVPSLDYRIAVSNHMFRDERSLCAL